MAEDLSDRYKLIAKRLLSGKVVPVLGAGANLSGRPPDAGYQWGRYLPNGWELAELLAVEAYYPSAEAVDLPRVSQYVAANLGEGALYEKLHKIFDADYPPTLLHDFLVRLARHIREARHAWEALPAPKTPTAPECMLIVTTNYDDTLERAFRAAGEPYDLVTYINDVEADRGLFRHIPFGGVSSVIRKPNEYTGLPLDQWTVIAKIHGAVGRFGGADMDSFVITEDDYVDYLTRADIARLFPIMLAEKVKRSHFLFLGYSLRDWNFRVMLYRLWREQERARFAAWAIEAHPNPVDSATWNERKVEILPVRVEDFIAEIERHFPPSTPPLEAA